MEQNPYYAYATIPGGMYPGTDEDVTTFGVRATFVTSANVPDDVIYEVVKAVFDNFYVKKLEGTHVKSGQSKMEVAEAVTSNAVGFGERMGVTVEGTIRVASNTEAEIVALANSGEFDLLVVGASNRPLTDRPFLGHRVHYILEHTEIPVAIVALPGQVGAPPAQENTAGRNNGGEVANAAPAAQDSCWVTPW